LPEIARQLLETLVVVGDGAQTGLLRRVSGRTLEEVDAGLSSLIAAQVIQSSVVSQHTWSFVHDLLREVVMMDTQPQRQQLLQLRAAQARVDVPLVAAHHFWQSRELWSDDDQATAVDVWLRAAGIFSLRNQHNDATAWFERAFTHAKRGNPQAKVLIERAHVLERYGKHEQALDTLADAEILLEDDGLLRVQYLVESATIYLRERQDPNHAELLANQALELVNTQPGAHAKRLRSDVLHILASIFHKKGDVDTMYRLHHQALTLRRLLSDRWRVAESLGGLAIASTLLGRAEAKQHYLESLTIREEVGDVVGRARSLGNLLAHYVTVEDVESALDMQQQALEAYEIAGIPLGKAKVMGSIGGLLVSQQKWQHAEEALLSSAQVYITLGIAFETNLILNFLDLYQHSHTEARGIAQFEQFLSIFSQENTKARDKIFSAIEELQKSRIFS
jgi:tetratricopeptide (TPR) repeat protein